MVNAMEWLHNQEEYNTKEKREKITYLDIYKKNLEGHLDLRDFVNLKELDCSLNKLTSIDLSGCSKLTWLSCHYNKLTSLDLSGCGGLTKLDCCSNQLTSIDFLKTLSQPEKLVLLKIFNNNIQPTDIAIFKPFVNLERLKLGTMEGDLKNGNRNKFYGSFQSWKDLSKLEAICIEATDVNEGLEYLPFSLAQATQGGDSYNDVIECSPHNTQAKCSQIQDQLRPFNYDLEAWQLAHPELMLKARPEYFTNPDSREQWINALTEKIPQTQQELIETKNNTPDKLKRIQRLESKINHLEIIKNLLEELAIEKDHSQDISRWYERQLGGENARKKNELFNQLLESKWNNRNQEQEIQQLKERQAITNQILEQEYQPKETANKETQTEFNDLEQQQQTIQTKDQQIKELTERLAQLENRQQQTETRTEIAPKRD